MTSPDDRRRGRGVPKQTTPLMLHLSCGQQLPVTSPDDRRSGPGEQARPADTAPQLRPAAAGDQSR